MILDSNIIIYIGKTTAEKPVLEFLEAHQPDLTASAISKLEVLGFHALQPNEKLRLEQFFQDLKMKIVSKSVIERAIKLRQQRKISLGDSIIAATALIHNLPVFTNNEKDFQHIEGLQVIPLKSI